MTSSKDLPENRFLFVGNYLCLDFINTEMVEAGQPVDRLNSFDSLVAWLVQSETLDEKQAEEILVNWKNSREAEATLRDATELRARLREMAERLAKGRTVPQSTVAAINEWLAHQTGHAELKRVSGGFEKRFQRRVSRAGSAALAGGRVSLRSALLRRPDSRQEVREPGLRAFLL